MFYLKQVISNAFRIINNATTARMRHFSAAKFRKKIALLDQKEKIEYICSRTENQYIKKAKRLFPNVENVIIKKEVQ